MTLEEKTGQTDNLNIPLINAAKIIGLHYKNERDAYVLFEPEKTYKVTDVSKLKSDVINFIKNEEAYIEKRNKLIKENDSYIIELEIYSKNIKNLEAITESVKLSEDIRLQNISELISKSTHNNIVTLINKYVGNINELVSNNNAASYYEQTKNKHNYDKTKEKVEKLNNANSKLLQTRNIKEIHQALDTINNSTININKLILQHDYDFLKCAKKILGEIDETHLEIEYVVSNALFGGDKYVKYYVLDKKSKSETNIPSTKENSTKIPNKINNIVDLIPNPVSKAERIIKQIKTFLKINYTKYNKG